jgi:hypothetical protein
VPTSSSGSHPLATDQRLVEVGTVAGAEKAGAPTHTADKILHIDLFPSDPPHPAGQPTSSGPGGK